MSRTSKSSSWLLGKPRKNDQNANIAQLPKDLDLFPRPSGSLRNLEHKCMEAEDIKVYSHVRSDSLRSLFIGPYVEELLELEIICRELRNEKEALQTSLLMEQSKNQEMIKKMEIEANERAKSHEEDKRCIENLELELKTLLDRLENLQEEINVKHVESNLVAEHVQSLEVKLADSDKLHEKINHLREELAKSEANRLNLKQELEDKKSKLLHTINCMNGLEEQLSAKSMKSELEMQSMRQELANSEQKWIRAQNTIDQQAKEMKQMSDFVNRLEDQLTKAQQTIGSLQNEALQLQGDFAKSEAKVSYFYDKFQEHLDQWLNRKNVMDHVISVRNEHSVTSLAGNKPSLDEQSSGGMTNREDFEYLFSKLVAVKNMEEKASEEHETMAQQLSQLHSIVAQLKEELREEKNKAKEEAEDFTQEMAELRYQLMEMLEQEREIRAHTEQASLHRVEELETQRRQERQQTLVALDHCHEAERVAEARAKEIEQLRLSLDGLKSLEEDLKNSRSREACLRLECEELASQVDWLHEKLAAAEQEIQVDNEQHVEVLIRYEEEQGWMEAEAGATKKSLEDQLAQVEQALAEKTAELDSVQEDSTKSIWSSSQEEDYGIGVKEAGMTWARLEEDLKHEKQLRTEAEQKQMAMKSSLEEALCKLSVAEIELDFAKQEIEDLHFIQQKTEQQLSVSLKEMGIREGSIHKQQGEFLEREKILLVREEELKFQALEHKKLLDRVAALVSEVQSLQQSLLSSQSYIAELNEKLCNMQEASSFERKKGRKFEEETRCNAEKIARKNEMLIQLQLKFNNLQNDFTSIKLELNDSRKKEKEAHSLVERLNLELSLAKEEVIKSEVRMQKVLKQAKEQLDSERRRHEELISAHKQAEWFMNKQLERLEKHETEKAISQEIKK